MDGFYYIGGIDNSPYFMRIFEIGGEVYQQLGYDLPVGSDGSGWVLRSSPDINYSYNPSIKTIDNEYGNGFKIKR